MNDLLMILNPLTLVGYPIGKTHVTAVGTLTAREAGAVLRTYEATAVVTQTRTMYSSDSQTERARALAAVRENIEIQIQADARYLRSLQSGATAAPARAEVQG